MPAVPFVGRSIIRVTLENGVDLVVRSIAATFLPNDPGRSRLLEGEVLAFAGTARLEA